MNWTWKICVWGLLGTSLVGCGKESSSGIPTSVTPTTSTTTTTGGSGGSASGNLPAPGEISHGPSCQLVSSARPTAAFAVRVYTQWPGASTWIRVDTGTCETSTISQTAINCTVSIPEAQLHYSKTYFEIFALNGSSQCDVIYYQPTSYLGSTSATALLPWNTSEIDCSKPYDSASCWNGAAKSIVPGFPRARGVFFSIKDLNYTQWCAGSMIASGYTGQAGWGTNRWTANTLAAGSRGTTVAGEYVASTMVDWGFQCVNRYADVLYAITMTLTDVNTDGTGPNDFPTWP